MAKDFSAKPNAAKNYTQSTESDLFQGYRDYSEFLPVVNRSESLQRFFGSTVNQLLSSGSTQSIDSYWGRLSGRSYNSDQESFQPETDALRLNYQFTPGVVRRDRDRVDSSTSYVNWLQRLASLGADLDNHDRLFSEPGYVLDIPINIDMFVNYTNYYWLEGDMPVIEIEPTPADPIDIDNIAGLDQYTTPTLENYRTVRFVTGLRVKFIGNSVTSTSGDYQADYVYYVENVGGHGGIKLIPSEDDQGNSLFPRVMPYSALYPKGWDLDPWDTTRWDERGFFEEYNISTSYLREDINLNKSYIVMERWARDMNPWSRSNQWFSVQALRTMANYNGVNLEAFLNNRTRAHRPIIEFRANMELFNTCKNFAGTVDYAVGFDDYQTIVTDLPANYAVDNGNNFLQDGDVILVTSLNLVDLVEYNSDYNFDFDASPLSNPFNGEFNVDFGTDYDLGIEFGSFASAFNNDFDRGGEDAGSYNISFNNDFDLFNNNTFSSDTAYVVSGVGSAITLTPAEVYNEGEYVIVTQGSQQGYSYCFDGTNWTVAQLKETKGDHPLFNLYDDEINELASLSGNNFFGDKIFGYKINSAGPFDPELGFAPTYSGQGGFNDFEFEWTLSNNRYNINTTLTSSEEVRGLYNWRDCVENEYFPGWSNVRGGQRVPIIQTEIADGVTAPSFNLGTTEVEYTTEYTLQYTDQGYRWFEHSYIDYHEIGEPNPDLIWKRETNYTVELSIANSLNDVEFVDPYGNSDPEISVSTVGNVATISISDDYAFNKVIYRSVTDSNIRGEIVLSNANHERYAVRKNGQLLIKDVDFEVTSTIIEITTSTKAGDVIELVYVADADLENTVYEVAPVHFYNSTNEPFVGASFSELFSHFDRQIAAMPGFEGKLVGENNYYNTRRIHTYDGTIRQQYIETPKLQYLLDQELINPIRALKSFSTDYALFKRQFKSKVKQLWTTESWDSVRELVDRALNDINIGKNEDFKYAHSDMAYYRQFEQLQYSITDSVTAYRLPKVRNKFGDTQNHIQIWLEEADGSGVYYERQLVEGVDYQIVGPRVILTNPATITTVLVPQNVISGGNNVVNNTSNVIADVPFTRPAVLTIRWYSHRSISHIPYSAVKLGFFRPTQVEVVDGVLIGHDGSRHTMTGTNVENLYDQDFDVVSAALLDYELRVFNNLVPEHDAQFDMGELYPSPHRNFAYDITDLNSRLDDWFNRWAVREGVTDISTSSYSGADEFTWNYTTVGPNLGTWRAIYAYYFGTDRPHTHPWEMLGFRTKPTWWDSYYSWTAGPARTALLNALKHGVISEPGQPLVVDIKYARLAYDWDNDILVTDDGTATLNGPVTAGIVPAPAAIDASKPFVFGDWGDAEDAWRTSSEYLFALSEVYLQLKPFSTHELWWSLARWRVNTNVTQTQWIDRDTCRRENYGEIHNQLIDGGVIVGANVVESGTGYTSATIMFPPSSICFENASASAFVLNGGIDAVVITDPGRGYRNEPNDVVITGNIGASGAELDFLVDNKFYVTHLGFNTLPAEEFTPEVSDSTELANALMALTVEHIIHVGGYTDKRILDIELDGSYTNGKIQLPQNSYDIYLDRSAPIKTAFFSGVKLTKVEGAGYRVEGYNLDNKFFVYNPVSSAGKSVAIQIGSAALNKRLNFRNETVRVPYRSTFFKRQDLYDFLLGLGNYYETIGFRITDRWEEEARSAIEWTLSTSDNPFYLNGIDETIVYEQGPQGFAQTVTVNYDGVPNVLDKNLRSIKRSDLLVLRNENTTEYSLKSGEDRIYGLGVRVIELEHVIAIRNETEFGDIVYAPEKGISQKRVRLLGEKTRNWNGKLEAPGYLVQNTGLVLNVESSVREVERDWVNSETKALERLTRQTLGYNVGYSKPTYLKGTFIDDTSAYRWAKGERKYKGTEYALDAISRNKNIFGAAFDKKLYEDWMVRLGDFGDKSEVDPLQFEVTLDLIKSDPQQFRFNANFVSDLSNDLIIDLHQGGPNAVSGNFATPFSQYPYLPLDNNKISRSNLFQNFNKDAGLPLATEIDYFASSIDDIGSIYDPSADYAAIPNWSQTTPYLKGDLVRLDGKVYQLAIESTGISRVQDDVVIRGTQVFPTVPNGQTAIFNGITVTFTKSSTSTETNDIVVTGTESNPTVASGSTLTVDGVNVNFIKTATTVTWQDIIIDGGVTSPLVVNSPSKTFVIGYANNQVDPLTTVTVNFNEEKTTETFQQIWSDAITTAANTINGGYSGTLSVAVNNFLNAFEALRSAYVSANSVAAWESEIDTIFNTGTTPTEFLSPSVVATITSGAWNAQTEALIDAMIVLLEGTTGISIADTGNDLVTLGNPASGTLLAQEAAVNAELASDPDLGDFTAWAANNGGLTITPSREIAVSAATPTRYVTDTLASAIVKINNALTLAGVTDIEASSFNNGSGNVLRITRTNTDEDYRLRILAGDANGDFGFANNIEGTLSSVTTTGGVPLTLNEAVVAFNQVGLSGVSAAAVGGQFRITSINDTLSIASSTAVAQLGLPTGVFNATTSSTPVPIDLTVYDVVEQINAAGILNLQAEQIEGAVILTYTGPSLVIGEGTANTNIGITAGTYTSQVDTVLNFFNAEDWNIIQDPAYFNIWVVDNIGSTRQSQTVTNRYQVYQTVDLEQGIIEICAGNENGDDALVKINKAHGLEVDDYVLILNSSCIPNVDGIHRVTAVQNETAFYIDRYIEQKGFTGKILPLRTMRFGDTNSARALLNNTKYVDNTLGLRQGTYVYVDQELDEFNVPLEYGAVYTIKRLGSSVDLTLERIEERKTDNSKLVNGVLYSNREKQTVNRYELFDPLKGIIPGIADAEIDIRSEADIVSYDNSTDPNINLRPETKWGAAQIGVVWWDLSTSIYLNYDQGPDDYRQEYWGQLFPTATVDIYEWTKSPVTPDEYEGAVNAGTIVDGIPLTGEPYSVTDAFGDVQYYWSEEIEFNENTNQLETFYYFWVRNKSTVPSIDRIYSTRQLEQIVLDPTSAGINWISATGTNTLLVSGLTEISGYNDLVMQVNFDKTDVDYHQEFLLLGENDPTVVIPQWLHIRLRDSLAGFNQLTATSNYQTWNNSDSYNINEIVKGSNDNFYIALADNTATDPVADVDMNVWRRIEIDAENPDGDYNGVDTVRYLLPRAVPDISLHPYERQGLGTRPAQSMFVDIDEARRSAVDKINDQLITINLVDSDIPWREEFDKEITVGNQTFRIYDYWEYVDWNADENDPFDINNAKFNVPTVNDLAALIPSEGDIARVAELLYDDNIQRASGYRYTNGEWVLIYREKGTIQFNDLLWNNELDNAGWDVTGWDVVEWDRDSRWIVADIFDSFYTKIWTDERQSLYADLWFHLVRHVFNEQESVDWIFKTSYIKTVFEDNLEKDYNKYFRQNIDELFDYINTVKPFRTKIREAIVQKNADDNAAIDLLDTIEIRVQTNIVGDGDFGDEFVEEDFLFEPLDAEEVNEDYTRSFRLNVNTNGFSYSSQIVNQHKKLLGMNIGATNTIIPIMQIGTTTLQDSAGAVWINGERIEYTGIVSPPDAMTMFGSAFTAGFSSGFGGVLFLTGVTRGTQGTLARPHSYADVIEDETNLRLIENTQLSDWGNAITPAWNILGETLTDVNNTQPNGVTLRDGAFGTIDLYGELQTAQWLALSETAEAISQFQFELEEFIETYWSMI